MPIDTLERVGRVVAAVVGVSLLTLAVTTPAWWGVLGILPLAIAFSGW